MISLWTYRSFCERDVILLRQASHVTTNPTPFLMERLDPILSWARMPKGKACSMGNYIDRQAF